MRAISYSFESKALFGRFFGHYPDEVVKNEPMFFSADASFAHEFGGSITRDFLDALFTERNLANEKVVFDSKVAMLMPGWFPCIPGWHHDDVPRSSPDGQPNYDAPEYRSKHAMGLVNGEICPTEFAVGEVELPGVPDGEVVYRSWHWKVEAIVKKGSILFFRAPSNRLIYFDDRTLHQGAAARGTGWRWFGRASWDTGREVKNEIRRQVQVYLSSPFDGW